MFVTSQGPMPATDLGFPDVCKTPVGPVVTPIPYACIGLSTTAIPNQTKLLLSAMPAHNLATVTPMTNGDQPGVLLGVVSNMVMGPAQAAMGSTNFLVGGTPATKLTSPTKQNGSCPNEPGIRISPSQIKLMSLR